MDELLKTDAVARMLGLSPGTLRRWRCLGRGPRYIKVGAVVRYDSADIVDWLSRRAIKPEAQELLGAADLP